LCSTVQYISDYELYMAPWFDVILIARPLYHFLSGTEPHAKGNRHSLKFGETTVPVTCTIIIFHSSCSTVSLPDTAKI
jgi:hypothetical protein